MTAKEVDKDRQAGLSADDGERFFEALKSHVQDAENNLKMHEELEIICHLRNGRVWASQFVFTAPNVISVYGNDSEGNRASIVAHVNTIQVELKNKASPLLATKHRLITFSRK